MPRWPWTGAASPERTRIERFLVGRAVRTPLPCGDGLARHGDRQGLHGDHSSRFKRLLPYRPESYASVARSIVQFQTVPFNIPGVIPRHTTKLLLEYLGFFPCVGLIGPRQCGKTTLLGQLGKGWLHFDLERQSDFEAIARDPDLFFRLHPDRVAIDEAQTFPPLFQALRVAVDADRSRTGRFVITGSSSPDLTGRISESLAGRIGLIEMGPFSLAEAIREPPSPFISGLSQGWKPERFVQGADTPCGNSETPRILVLGRISPTLGQGWRSVPSSLAGSVRSNLPSPRHRDPLPRSEPKPLSPLHPVARRSFGHDLELLGRRSRSERIPAHRPRVFRDRARFLPLEDSARFHTQRAQARGQEPARASSRLGPTPPPASNR